MSEIDLELLWNILLVRHWFMCTAQKAMKFSMRESISMRSILKTRVLKLDCESIFIPISTSSIHQVPKLDCESIFISIPASSMHQVVNCDYSIRRNCKPVFQWHYMASVEVRAGKWLEMWIMGLVSVQWHCTCTLFLPHAHVWIAAVPHLYTLDIASCHLLLPKTYSGITY
jgi:hypothetical protein